MAERFCADCQFFQPGADNPQVGECRRHAPSPVQFGQLNVQLLRHDIHENEADAVWPLVDASEWCGEWERKD